MAGYQKLTPLSLSLSPVLLLRSGDCLEGRELRGLFSAGHMCIPAPPHWRHPTICMQELVPPSHSCTVGQVSQLCAACREDLSGLPQARPHPRDHRHDHAVPFRSSGRITDVPSSRSRNIVDTAVFPRGCGAVSQRISPALPVTSRDTLLHQLQLH